MCKSNKLYDVNIDKIKNLDSKKVKITKIKETLVAVKIDE